MKKLLRLIVAVAAIFLIVRYCTNNLGSVITLPGGTDYAQINVYPTSVGASAAVTDGVCKYCGKVHPSHLWGRIVALFHLLLYFFKNAFGL